MKRELEMDPGKIFYLVAPLWKSQVVPMVRHSKKLAEKVWFPARPEEPVRAKLDNLSLCVVSCLSHRGRL